MIQNFISKVLLEKAVVAVCDHFCDDAVIKQARNDLVGWLDKKAADTTSPIDDKFVSIVRRFLGIGAGTK